jgi:hypothetical protein
VGSKIKEQMRKNHNAFENVPGQETKHELRITRLK